MQKEVRRGGKRGKWFSSQGKKEVKTLRERELGKTNDVHIAVAFL